jgi:hypothetical protein
MLLSSLNKKNRMNDKVWPSFSGTKNEKSFLLLETMSNSTLIRT